MRQHPGEGELDLEEEWVRKMKRLFRFIETCREGNQSRMVELGGTYHGSRLDENHIFGVVELETEQQKILDLDERSEELTSELQSRENLVCRLLLEKKKKKIITKRKKNIRNISLKHLTYPKNIRQLLRKKY